MHVVAEYIDHGVSGIKGRDKRPQYDALCKSAVRREFDVVMAWSVDHLSRFLQHLVSFLGEVHAKGMDLYLQQQGNDTTNPAGKSVFQMCGVFAGFERAMIQKRVRVRLARAVTAGKRFGRPLVPPKMESRIRATRLDGKGIRKIASELGVRVSVVKRVVAI